MAIVLLILGLILFVGLVVVHEFGHFIAARRNGVEVEEFGIGFPPRAWSKKMKSGFRFSLNWLPLGGFVRLKGEHDDDRRPGSFGAASLKAKVKIMLAGVVMNLLTAFVLLTLLALIGLPKVLDDQFTVKNDTKVIRHNVLIGYVEPDSPADQAGLLARDELLSIESDQLTQPIPSAEQLPLITEQYAEQQVIITYEREGSVYTTNVKLRSSQEVETSKATDSPKGYLGIIPTEYVLRRSTWSAPIVAAGFIKQVTVATYQGIASALSGLFSGDTAKASEQVSGPVGIFVLLKDGSLLGIHFVLFIIAIISLTLAIMNVLPIPALDGGRLFVTLLFKAIRKPLKRRTEELIHGTGFALLMLLFVLITVVDVRRFF